MSQSLSAPASLTGTNLLQPFSDVQLANNAKASSVLRQVYGKRMTQQINSGSFVPVFGQSTVLNLVPQPIGLITKFYLQMQVVITNPAGGSTLTRGSFGPFATASLISYTDPTSNNRIQTTGYHLAAVTARRHRRVPGAALTTDSPSGFGSVMTPVSAPATIAANASGTVNVMYEIPLSFGRNSLKGAVFAGAVFATQQLQITFNPNFCQATVAPLGCVYTGAGTGANAPTYAVTWTFFQEYWDQFPLALLPPLAPDLSTIYELKQTSINNIVSANDNYVRFNNLREFQSVMLAYDQNGTLNAGTDINYFLLQSANQTTIWRRTAPLQSYKTRNHFGDDFPAGVYMFDFSDAPIVTAAEGNTVLSLNPSTAAALSVIQIGWEDLATSTVLASASSLAGTAGVG